MSFASREPAAGVRPISGVRRLWRRTGVRLFALQALALVLAFGLTGAILRVSIQRLGEQAMRAEVTGEAHALEEEWRQKGLNHLPHTVTKRARLWRGFEYGLAGPDGRPLAGDPRLARLRREGWSRTPSDGGLALARTQRLPDGGWLTVGRLLTTQQRELGALTLLLGVSWALGAAICLASAWLAMRWTWGRIDQLSATAARVAEGRLDVRAAVRSAATPDEIDDLSLTFNQMLNQIGRLIAELRRVTTDIAHDMRRPLNRLGQNLDRLSRAAETAPEFAAEVRRLEADFQEITRTFDALLQLAEIEGRGRPDAHVDLAAVTERVVEALRPDIEASGHTLAVRLEAADVTGDTDLLAQAIANLLENALRHTPGGSHIDVRVQARDGAPRLLVRDNGPGIPADLRQRALAPFGRLERSRSTPGSGLGLAIAASVVMRHGARLELADAGPGLEVSVAFPPG